MDVPALTTAQMVEVDRLMVAVYGISLLQMMENAGRNLALQAKRMVGAPAGARVVVLCGAGNNGGGGMVAARHLHNWGADVRATLVVPPEKLKEVPAHQWRILQAMGVVAAAPELAGVELVVEAMIGYGLEGNPRGGVARWIERVNGAGVRVLALDAPAGLDTTTGAPGVPCIVAAATLTLALPKVGLLTDAARPVVGDLFLADIGVPPALYERLGLEVGALFQDDTIMAL